LIDLLRYRRKKEMPLSRLTDLIAHAKAKDPQLGADLDKEFKVLSARLPFGLNFERHRPEAVELPERPIRKGDKVRVQPPRGSTKNRRRVASSSLRWMSATNRSTSCCLRSSFQRGVVLSYL
jgi:hypothetical protein